MKSINSLTKFKLDSTHLTVKALKSIVPMSTVYGGSFANWLPSPNLIRPELRKVTLEIMRKRAIDFCIDGILNQIGLLGEWRMLTKTDGQRAWPPGYIGSMTHKGTIVLCAVATQHKLKSLGIDLEYRTERDKFLNRSLIARDGAPNITDETLGTLMAFSAKEAVFKSFYPIESVQIGFDDVKLIWKKKEFGFYKAKGIVLSDKEFKVSCIVKNNWIISGAYPA